MKLNGKKILLLSLAAISIVFISETICFAQNDSGNLENEYPGLPGLAIQEIPTSTTTALPVALKYFFHFIVLASGLIIFGSFIKGGAIYLLSKGNPGMIKLAKDQMTSAAIGIGIILCSWLLLNTINPRLLYYNITLEEIPQITYTKPAGEAASTTIKYLQIPVGMLIERTLLGTDAIARISQANQNLNAFEKKAKELKDLSEELKDLALSFNCGDSSCASNDACASTCDVDYDENGLKNKVQEVNDKIEELNDLKKAQVRPNRWDINDPRYDLKVAAALITGACPSGAVSQLEFLGIKKYLESKGAKVQIDVFPGWPSNKLQYGSGQTDDPAAFYCSGPDLYAALEAASVRTDEISETIPLEDFPPVESSKSPDPGQAPEGSENSVLENYPTLYQNDSSIIDPQVRSYGCGPTSLATVLRFYGIKDGDKEVTPDSLTAQLRACGAFTDGEGMNFAPARPFIQKTYNLTPYRFTDVSTIITEIKNDRPVVILCTGIYSLAHFMVVYGVNFSGDRINTAFIMDPLKGTSPCTHLSGYQLANQCESFTSFRK